MPAKIPKHANEQRINNLPNIEFLRWDGEYRNSHSKAVCKCSVDGFEWSASINNLIIKGNGCPQCGGNRRFTEEERIAQINSIENISFIRWEGGYRNAHSKAVCRCLVDGFEWSASAISITRRNCHGCPQCAGCRRWTEEEMVYRINELPNISFVRWSGCGYSGSNSKAVCVCGIDGNEWTANVRSLLSAGCGCPKCATHGYSPAKSGSLYVLRSECGVMAKIGISNNYQDRHRRLKLSTPFGWSCIELIHSDDGTFIAKAEKELHSLTEQAQFSEPFDGYTEWRKWDDRIPMWIEEYRARA